MITPIGAQSARVSETEFGEMKYQAIATMAMQEFDAVRAPLVIALIHEFMERKTDVVESLKLSSHDKQLITDVYHQAVNHVYSELVGDGLVSGKVWECSVRALSERIAAWMLRKALVEKSHARRAG